MAAIQEKPNVLDEVLEFLTTTPTPEQIIDFKPSEALEQYISYLLHQNRNGYLTAEERQELDEMLELNHFMSLLKARARKKLLPK